MKNFGYASERALSSVQTYLTEHEVTSVDFLKAVL